MRVFLFDNQGIKGKSLIPKKKLLPLFGDFLKLLQKLVLLINK